MNGRFRRPCLMRTRASSTRGINRHTACLRLSEGRLHCVLHLMALAFSTFCWRDMCALHAARISSLAGWGEWPVNLRGSCFWIAVILLSDVKPTSQSIIWPYSLGQTNKHMLLIATADTNTYTFQFVKYIYNRKLELTLFFTARCGLALFFLTKRSVTRNAISSLLLVISSRSPPSWRAWLPLCKIVDPSTPNLYCIKICDKMVH